TDATVQSGRVLIMVNTRRKAREIYEQISKFREDVIYLSAGITKKQRREIVQAINSDEPVLAVSTQVLEAGVDISFDKIFREMAPLDNIVQTMGRLNREGKSLVTPTLTVFEIDEDAAPYDPLEMKLSKQILPRISDSKALYMVLPDYYRELAKAHATNKIRLSELETKMRKLCFDDVWDFVKRKALPADVGDTVFIPRENEWEKVKDTFLFGKFAYQRVAEYAAELPKSFIELNRKHGLQSMFDADLMQREILLPKKEHLADIYDVKVGLDKWTM
ncbi:MAG: helicase-related protein, partial [Candidatus Bathyarchaeia archaeon]